MAILKLKATAETSGGFSLVWVDKPTLYTGSVYVNQLEVDVSDLTYLDAIILATIKGCEPISLLAIGGDVNLKTAYLPKLLTDTVGQKEIGISIKVPYIYQGETKYRMLTTKNLTVDVLWSASDIGNEDTLPQSEVDNLRELIESSATIFNEKCIEINNDVTDNTSNIAKLDVRTAVLESTSVKKVLVDFSVNTATGEGVKYYSDGSTSTVQYPTGGGGGGGGEIVTDLIKVLSFNESAFYVASDGSYELAFSGMATGYNNSNFVSILDKVDRKSFESGTDVEQTMHDGYSQLADTFFKGSDGSLLLYGMYAPFSGRLVLLGGTVYGGALVDGGCYDRPNNQIVLSMYNGEVVNIPLIGIVNDGEYVHTDNNFTSAYKELIGTINERDSLMNVSVDSNTYLQTFEQRYGDNIVVQLPKPAVAQRFMATYSFNDWQGEIAPYTLTISERVHKKGATPMWQTMNNQVFDVEVNYNGDLTIYTNTKKEIKIIIF